MSVLLITTAVMLTQSAGTLWDHTTVLAKLDSLETEKSVLVTYMYNNFTSLIKHFENIYAAILSNTIGYSRFVRLCYVLELLREIVVRKGTTIGIIN